MTAFALTAVSGAMIVGANAAIAIALGESSPDTTPTYRLLEDHQLDDQQFLAGTILSEADWLPLNWVPTPNVDPLTTAATQNFYAQGPRILGLVRVQYSVLDVQLPVTAWIQISPGIYALTGLGSNHSTYPPLSGV